MDGFKLLQLTGGYRTSNYSSAGDVQSWKYGVEWAPVEDIKGRASWQRAVRAPNVVELFFPQSIGLWGGQDPCSGPAPVLSAGECALTGVPGFAYGTVEPCPSAQCSGLFGGNPNLDPEVSDTESFGVVFTPTFFEGFSLTADWFDIEVEGAVGIIPQIDIINTCATTGALCGLIHRDPAANYSLVGNTSFVDSFLVNTGSFKTSGIDIEANYRTALADWGMGENGTLSLHFIGTWLDSFDLLNSPLPDDHEYSCKGLFGVVCGTPIPEWRHAFRVTWSSAWDWDFTVNWRYLSDVHFDANQDDDKLNGICGAPCGDLSDDKIDAYNYIDVAVQWNVSEGVQLRAGMNNVFDKDPPFIDGNYLGISSPPFGNGNTYPQVYDSLGRVVFVGATVKM
jgi:outer membrane receptor protein involved in Fe transport